MRTIQATLLIAILSLPVQMFLPWWWLLAVVAFVIGYLINLAGYKAFIAGFVGNAAVWWGYAGYTRIRTHGILSNKIAVLFHLPNPWLLVLIAGIIAGLVGGMAAVSGRELKRLV